MDVDKEYYERGGTDYDYVIPLCFNNQTFLLKVDLTISMLYLASDDLNTYNKYIPANSLTHGNYWLDQV